MDQAKSAPARMNTTPDNPTEVLQTLDRELDHEVSLVLYGRAVLYLGFPDAPAEFGTTQDVDGIIRLAQLPALMEDHGFWDGQERANRILEPRGLYITHLFCEVRSSFVQTGNSISCLSLALLPGGCASLDHIPWI